MDNKSTKTISLKEFTKNFTAKDREIIESEKRYYDLVVTLKKTRESIGLTQEQLASISKIPRTTITKIESGGRNTTLDTLMTLAYSMGKTLKLSII